MGWSIRIFRVKGIDVKVHLTFVFILIWVAISWGTADNGGIRDAAFGVVATLFLFGCITLHELAHSIVALRFGVRVHDIILLPIGGVSQIEEMPDKPAEELQIAAAGPLVSFALAAVFYVLTLLIGGASASFDLSLATVSTTWPGLFAYLAAANLLLGLFNILPAFPMDGGRILRALLALRLDYARATAIASTLGQTLAIALGLAGFITGNFLMILVAIFVWLGAGQESGDVQTRGVLGDTRVEQAMTREPLSLAPSDSLDRAVDLTLSTEQSDFPVVDPTSQRVVGLLTRDDLLRGLRQNGENARVDQAMRSTFVAATPDDRLYPIAHRLLAEQGGGVAPVVDATGRLVGLLTTADVNEALLLLGAKRGAKRRGV
jgi:Zn-dependent protease/predicted transcriptional regulator